MKLYPLVFATSVVLSTLSVSAFATPTIQLHQVALQTKYDVEYLPYTSGPGQENEARLTGSSTSYSPLSSVSSNYSDTSYFRNRGRLDTIVGEVNITNRRNDTYGLSYDLSAFVTDGYIPGDSILEDGSPLTPSEQQAVDNGFQDVASINFGAYLSLEFTVLDSNSTLLLGVSEESYLDGNIDPFKFSLYDTTDGIDLVENYIRYSNDERFTLEEGHRYQLSAFLEDPEIFQDNSTFASLAIEGKLMAVDAPSSLALLMGSLFCLISLRKRHSKQA